MKEHKFMKFIIVLSKISRIIHKNLYSFKFPGFPLLSALLIFRYFDISLLFKERHPGN